jgi:hypothetical protein
VVSAREVGPQGTSWQVMVRIAVKVQQDFDKDGYQRGARAVSGSRGWETPSVIEQGERKSGLGTTVDRAAGEGIQVAMAETGNDSRSPD